MKQILAADIGGTSSRFAQFTLSEEKGLEKRHTHWLKTADASSFDELLVALQESEFPLPVPEADCIVVAVAGPVLKGVYADPPNIPWAIDLRSDCNPCGAKEITLINDFVAQAYACRSPVVDSAESILKGEASEEGAVAVIGAGTGLGKGALLQTREGGYIACPSEGGHTNIAIETVEEFEFSQFVLKERPHLPYVVWDEVVSGRGLSIIHQFLTGERLSPAEVSEHLEEETKTQQWVSRFYARVCRNFALELLATGGVYIAGGVAAKNPLLVKSDAFSTTFRNNDAHSEILEKIPVWLLDDEESGLWGAGFFGEMKLRNLGF